MFYINTKTRKLFYQEHKEKIEFIFQTIDKYTFAFYDENGNPVELNSDDLFYIVGSDTFSIDEGVLFYSDTFSIEGNTVTFTINTGTQEFLDRISGESEQIYFEIGRKVSSENYYHVMLHDDCIASMRLAKEGASNLVTSDAYYTKKN